MNGTGFILRLRDGFPLLVRRVGGGLEVTRQSVWSNKTRKMTLAITLEQLRAWIDGTLIQKAMPHLDAGGREFLMSGMTPEEFYIAFGFGEE